MVQRGTPSNVEKYIKIYEQHKIYELSKKGIHPIFIDKEYAYFEPTRTLINSLVEIMENVKQERS